MSLAAAASFYAANKFYAYDSLVSLLPFHESPHPRRLIRKPNQVGGSYACAWEAWAHLIGRHRWQPDVRPASGLVLVANIEDAYPQVCEKLRLTEPTHLLDPATKYVEGKGYFTNSRRLVRTMAKHRIEYRGGEGDPMGVESATVGWCWVDEPPKQTHLGAAISRVAVATGPCWMNFTPINRPVAYLRLRTEGDPRRDVAPLEEWVQFRPKLTQADCTTVGGRVIRSQASIDIQVAGYDAWERMQRVYGEWEGISDVRRFSAFGEDVVSEDAPFDAAVDTSVGVGADHGEAIGNQVAVLARYQVTGDRRIVHVVGETVSTRVGTEEDDARAILDMLARDGVELRHVDRMVGDVNSAGKAGAGRSVNELLTEALNRQAGYPDVLVEMEGAQKGRILDRVRALNLAMMRGELLVHPRCTSLVECLRYWDGTPATEHFKHLLDALCYLLCPLLEPPSRDRRPAAVEMIL